jgi:hypothetical protein
MIRASSMTVTAVASTNDPNGSPTRCATTSAWCTAANTAPIRNTASTAASAGPGFEPHVNASATRATKGTTTFQDTRFDIARHSHRNFHHRQPE